MTKFKKFRLNKGIEAKAIAEMLGFNKVLMSLVETNKLLLFPKDLRKVTHYLNCEFEDLYDEKDLYIKKQVNVQPTELREKERELYCRPTFRIPRSLEKVFSKENVQKVGYLNKTDWLLSKIYELEEEVLKFDKSQEKMSKKEKQA